MAQVRGISIFREYSLFKGAHTAVDTAHKTRRVKVGKGGQADFVSYCELVVQAAILKP